MMFGEIFLGFTGLCFGVVIASGVVAFIISLGIVPRYAGITKTADHIGLYEECAMLGAILGNLLFLYKWHIPVGSAGLAVWGIFSGIFLGSWIVALGEIVNVYAIMARRVGITKGIGLIIISMALGKMLGSLLFFWKGWW
jgi:stage V sporulation protein AB